jgi:hypothetical protein
LLRECVIDEQLELYMDELIAAEIAEELRIEIRSMLAKGLK